MPRPTQQQAIEFGASGTRLYFAPKVDGRFVKPSSAPTYALLGRDESSLGTGTMTAEDPSREFAFLDYDNQASEFSLGDVITGGTSAATAVVVGDQADGESGRLHLSDVDGTFEDDEEITGARGGQADVDGAPYSPWYYVEIDASDDATWPVERDYVMKVQFAESGGPTLTRYHYFDVALYPMISPSVTTEEIDELHPRWAQKRPRRWADWTVPIREAHRKLVERVNASGENAAQYVKRDTEFHGILLAFVRSEIARELKDDADEYRKLAESAWSSRGLLTVSDDSDVTPERTTAYLPVRRVR
jgi:hypothetical protein